MIDTECDLFGLVVDIQEDKSLFAGGFLFSYASSSIILIPI